MVIDWRAVVEDTLARAVGLLILSRKFPRQDPGWRRGEIQGEKVLETLVDNSQIDNRISLAIC